MMVDILCVCGRVRLVRSEFGRLLIKQNNYFSKMGKMIF